MYVLFLKHNVPQPNMKTQKREFAKTASLSQRDREIYREQDEIQFSTERSEKIEINYIKNKSGI